MGCVRIGEIKLWTASRIFNWGWKWQVVWLIRAKMLIINFWERSSWLVILCASVQFVKVIALKQVSQRSILWSSRAKPEAIIGRILKLLECNNWPRLWDIALYEIRIFFWGVYWVLKTSLSSKIRAHYTCHSLIVVALCLTDHELA